MIEEFWGVFRLYTGGTPLNRIWWFDNGKSQSKIGMMTGGTPI